MAKQVPNGTKEHVSVKLEFEGVIYNYSITVENQFISIVNNSEGEADITFDGDPVAISGLFRGEVNQSKVKTFEVTINGYTYKNNGLNIKTGELEIKSHVPYPFFDLKP